MPGRPSSARSSSPCCWPASAWPAVPTSTVAIPNNPAAAAPRRRRLHDRLLALLEHAGELEEAVQHAVVAGGLRLHARAAQPGGVLLTLVPQRVVLRRDHERRRQPAQVLCQQRRRVRVLAVLR